MALKFIKDLWGRIAVATGEKRSTYFLFQSLGMATQHYGLVDYINKGLQIGLIPSWACSRDTRGLHQPKKLGLY